MPDLLLLELWPLLKEECPFIDMCIWLGALQTLFLFVFYPAISFLIFLNIFKTGILTRNIQAQ